MSAVLYEVTLRVRPAIADAYLAWLHAHVAEMRALPGFEAATLSRVDVDAGADAVYCCHYRLRDADALDAYLRDHAPRMRADGLRRFGDGFAAERRVLAVLGDY